MGALWIIVSLLTIVVIAVLLLPFLRNRHQMGDSEHAARSAYDLNVYKDQLNEIERDHERGLLSADQVEAARLEVQRRILAVADVKSGVVQSNATGRTVLMILIAVLVPVGAITMYGYLGSPTTPDFPFATRQQQPNSHQAGTKTSTKQLIKRLKARLARQPNNIRGWLLLTRSAMSIQQYDQVVNAYRKAIALGKKQPGHCRRLRRSIGSSQWRCHNRRSA